MGLESLSPELQSEYAALLPEIRRSSQSANNARGMFYSGQATDAETRAEADLLAKLAAQQNSTNLTQSEGDKNRRAAKDESDRNIAATKRAQTLALIGSGFGAATTLGGLKYMMPKSNNFFINPNDGKAYMIDSAGKATQINLPGAGGVNAGVGGSTLDSLGIPQSTTPFTPGAGPGMAAPMVGAPGGAAVAAQPSMWQNAQSAGIGGLAAGAAGGFAGDQFARKVNGGGGLKTDLGAAAGGAAVPLAMLAAGYSNPWALGLGALTGSFGGGLISNLFH